jgi:hypothetical protein
MQSQDCLEPVVKEPSPVRISRCQAATIDVGLTPPCDDPWIVKYASGTANDPIRDNRVEATERFLDERRREALAMMTLWPRSLKPYARDELNHR